MEGPSAETAIRGSVAPNGKARWSAFRRGLLPCVVGLALAETGLHLWQTRRTSEPEDYDAAAAYVRAQIHPSDGIVFRPAWSSPVGRLHFGDLVTMERAAPTDTSRYDRIFFVHNRSSNGEGAPGWETTDSRSFGVVRVDTLHNPRPEPVLSSTLELFANGKVEGFVHGPAENRACPRMSDRGSALSWDPALPPERLQCDGSGVGLVMSIDQGFVPKYCLAAAPIASPRALRLRFRGVHFGTKLVGHHGIHVVLEQPLQPDVDAVFWAELPEDQSMERPVGKVTFHDGKGYTEFAFATEPLAGKTGDLVVDIQSNAHGAPHYCFEATTR